MAFDGFDQVQGLASNLDQGAATAAARARLIVRRSAMQVEALAKQNAPVDTGNLRNSITTVMQGNQVLARASVGPTANYGGFVEHGTSRMAPRPYLGPALDAVRPSFVAAMAAMGASVTEHTVGGGQ